MVFLTSYTATVLGGTLGGGKEMTSKIGAIASAVMIMVGTQTAGCSEHTVGGLTAKQAFPDPKLAELASAACVGDTGRIARALREGASPNGLGKQGSTPLFWAIHCENLQGIEALLNAGANPNYKMPGHFTATYVAAGMWNPAPLKILLKHGADPNTFYDDASEKTALREALTVGLDGHGFDNYYALLEAGADINRADSVGNTIATWAVALGAFDKVEELLKRGYKYDLVDLGRNVQIRLIDPARFPEQAAAKARIIEMLKQRGVHFPVPPKVEREKQRS
jgi:uncharacterized protein